MKCIAKTHAGDTTVHYVYLLLLLHIILCFFATPTLAVRHGCRYTSAFHTGIVPYGQHRRSAQSSHNFLSTQDSHRLNDVIEDTLVVCNWKCYTSSKVANESIRRFAKLKPPDHVKVLTAPSSLFLHDMVTTYKEANSECIPCAQDVSAATPSFGPFTGEITAGMLRDIDVNWTIIGHSERREKGVPGIAEERQLINQKLKAALSENLNVIVCIGEKGNGDKDYVVQQLQDICDGVDAIGDSVLVAYEPSKCVGTDKPLLPEEANETIEYIKLHSNGRFDRSRFLYGGSVDHNTAPSYVRQPHINGIMVGRIWQDPQFELTLSTLTSH